MTGCSSTTTSTPTSLSASATSSTAHATATTSVAPTPVNPADAKGIITSTAGTDGSCTLHAINPTTGVATKLVTFKGMKINCPGSSQLARYRISPDLNRIAVGFSDVMVGWIDATGLDATPGMSQHPDFGSSLTDLHAYGFDQQGNFYYSGLVGPAGDVHRFYRVPPPVGTAEPQRQQIAEYDGDAPFGPLPDGTLGIKSQHMIWPVDANKHEYCDSGIGSFMIDDAYDPGRTAPYFYTYGVQEVLYRTADYCAENGTPIMQRLNVPISGGIVSNPDHSLVAISVTGNRIFLAAANGDANSMPVKTINISGLGSDNFSLIGWR
jgi:hypothetical protein